MGRNKDKKKMSYALPHLAPHRRGQRKGTAKKQGKMTARAIIIQWMKMWFLSPCKFLYQILPPRGGLASGSAHAGASASASVPDPSNKDISELVQHLVATTQHVQSQMGKIDILPNKMSEMAINQSNMSAQVAGMKGRIDTIDSRFVKLEEGSKDAPVSQAHPSTNAWGDVPCAPAASTSTLPAPAPLPNTPKVYSHWDRPMDPTILRISTNKHKVALGAVGDAFAKFFETINLSHDRFAIHGPDLGSNSTLELMGRVPGATKWVQRILRAVKKDGGPPPEYCISRPRIPAITLSKFFSTGTKMVTFKNLRVSPSVSVHSLRGRNQTSSIC